MVRTSVPRLEEPRRDDGCFAERAVTRRESVIEHVDDMAAIALNALLQRSCLLKFS